MYLKAFLEKYGLFVAIAFIVAVVLVVVFSPAKESTCTIDETGSCTAGSIKVPSTPGFYTFEVCIDKNSDRNFKDIGECSEIVIQVV